MYKIYKRECLNSKYLSSLETLSFGVVLSNTYNGMVTHMKSVGTTSIPALIRTHCLIISYVSYLVVSEPNTVISNPKMEDMINKWLALWMIKWRSEYLDTKHKLTNHQHNISTT